MPQWKFDCEFCGEEYLSRNPFAKYCKKCKDILSFCKAWEGASICICCGELNPFFQLHISGHHLFGRDNSDVSIPICANCHELTRNRNRQGFFLFELWKMPKARFTEDNSGIYVHL